MTIADTLRALPGRPLADYQIADIETIEENDGQCLYAGCLGSRKTGTGTAYMALKRGVWLVVAPLGTFDGWLEAFKEWAPDADVHVITNKNRTGLIDLKQDTSDFSIHLINWEYLRRQDLSKFKNIDGAILDEVHRMAGYGTATQKAVWRINSTWRIGLSGTPANNKLHQLYNVLRWIWWGNKDHKQKNIFRRFALLWGQAGVDEERAWLRRHFYLLKKDNYGGMDTGYDIGAEKRFHSVLDEVPCYIQHLEEEKCCEFHPQGVNATLPPEESPKFLYVDMTPAQEKVYGSLAGRRGDHISKDKKASPVLWLDTVDGDRASSLVANDQVARIRRRQVALAVPSIEEVEDQYGVKEKKIVMKPDAKSSVSDALLDLLTDIVEPGDPVMVYTFSKVFAKMLVERINKRFGRAIYAAEWSGDVKKEDRNTLKSVFGQPDQPNVIVAVIASIAEGVDGLQKVCRKEVWCGEEENDMLNIQAIGRLRRTGQPRRIHRYYILTRGTAELDQTKARRKNRAELQAALKAN